MGFLHEYLPRIIFGISVFHAFGHQWPCQIVYHPRKCRGCERFWSAIRKLIPSLRVSGVSGVILMAVGCVFDPGSYSIFSDFFF